MDVYLVNESTLLTSSDAWRIAWACDRQVRFHFGRSGWRSDVRCHYMPAGSRIPVGGAVMHLLDTLDVQGALGYHDEDGNLIPFARVGVKTSLDVGGQVSEVCSHELLELAADPHVNQSALNGDGSKLFAFEVGDPVQGSAYDVGEPEGRQTGVVVANFALPAYFDPNSTSGKVDYRGVLRDPFTIAPQGYMSYIDMSNPSGGWQQTLGSERTAPPPPDLDDRPRRRGNDGPLG